MLQSTRQIGGDLHDRFRIGEDRLCMVVGEVSGTGTGQRCSWCLPAACLRAATLQAFAITCRAPAICAYPPPVQ